jgi:hypothetical protein
MNRLILALGVALWCVSARAAPVETVPTEVATGVFYFSEDPSKKQAAESERGEDGLLFQSDRDPRDVARDAADEEIRRGNVCLRQVRNDLHVAAKKFRVRGLCREIYSEELAAEVEKASRTKMHPDVFRCYAEAEAHEKEGFVTVSLVFRGQLATHTPVPRKFQRAGFPDEPVDWSLPTHTLSADPGRGWKEALKDGACTFDTATLDKLGDRLQAERRVAGEWIKCRDEESRARERLTRLQAQFKAYVPDDWVEKEETGELLNAPASGVSSPVECRETLAGVTERLKSLRSLSNRIAGEHGVTALRETPASRAPASVEVEGEE